MSIVSSDYQAKAETSGHTKNVWLYQKRLLVLLRHLIVRKPLSCCREVSRIVVVPFLLLCLYPNAVYQFHRINLFEVRAVQDVISSS